LAKEAQIDEENSRYAARRNFFEIQRVDFLIDDEVGKLIYYYSNFLQFKPHLLEFNMSPYLDNTKDPSYQKSSMQIILGALKLVGLADVKEVQGSN